MNYKDDDNQTKRKREILMIKKQDDNNEEEEEKNGEEILDICNIIASGQIQNLNFENIKEYIEKLIHFPEYDYITEKLFKLIDPLILIEEFSEFLKRNQGNSLLKIINVGKINQKNDEIIWNIIGQLIILRKIDISEIIYSFFDANISDNLFEEILDIIFSIIIITKTSEENVLYLALRKNTKFNTSMILKILNNFPSDYKSEQIFNAKTYFDNLDESEK